MQHRCSNVEISKKVYDSFHTQFITFHLFHRNIYEPRIDLLPMAVASKLSWLEHRTGIMRSQVQTLLKSRIFFQASLMQFNFAYVPAKVKFSGIANKGLFSH